MNALIAEAILKVKGLDWTRVMDAGKFVRKLPVLTERYADGHSSTWKALVQLPVADAR